MKWPYHHVKDLVYRLKDKEQCLDQVVYDVCNVFDIERGLVSKALYSYYWADKKGREHEIVTSYLSNGLSIVETVLALRDNEEFLNINLERVIRILVGNR